MLPFQIPFDFAKQSLEEKTDEKNEENDEKPIELDENTEKTIEKDEKHLENSEKTIDKDEKRLEKSEKRLETSVFCNISRPIDLLRVHSSPLGAFSLSVKTTLSQCVAALVDTVPFLGIVKNLKKLKNNIYLLMFLLVEC